MHLGGVWKHIVRIVVCFKDTEVTRLWLFFFFFFAILFPFKVNCELKCCKTPDGKEAATFFHASARLWLPVSHCVQELKNSKPQMWSHRSSADYYRFAFK